MKRRKRLTLIITAIVLCLVLVAFPLLMLVSPAQAAITWTRHGAVFDLLPEGAGAACVINDGGTYKMWYTHGQSDITIAGTTGAIGYATSPNRREWTVQNPTVLDKSAPGAWDDKAVGTPAVIYDSDDDKYKMWYTGVATGGTLGTTVPAIGYAESDDGITWVKQVNPVLDGTGGGNWDDDGVEFPCVIKDDVTYKWYIGNQ